MYELQTVVKTQPYLKDVQERCLPSCRRTQVQERERTLVRMQSGTNCADNGTSFGRIGARIATWLRPAAVRPAGHA